MDAASPHHPDARAAERVRAAIAPSANVVAFPSMASFVKPRAQPANVVSLAEWRKRRAAL